MIEEEVAKRSHSVDQTMAQFSDSMKTRWPLEDSLATGEVFIKMIPLLEEKGIVTVRQALEASEKTYFARVKY